MADPLADSGNVFDQIGPDIGVASPAPAAPPPMPVFQPAQTAPTANDNAFDEGPDISPDTSAKGSFGRGLLKSIAPTVGSLPAMGAGAELGAALGALGGPAAPITVPVGGLIGAVGGALIGGHVIAKAQDWVLSQLPDSWTEAIGMDDRQGKLDAQHHGTAAFLGGMVPMALTMRPGMAPLTKLPENATALQRIMANPVTARVFGGSVMGGMELGQEAIHGDVNWTHVGIATGVGVVFNQPTRFGQRLINVGARRARGELGRPEPTPEATEPAIDPQTAPEATPELSAIEQTLQNPRPPGVTEKEWNETILGQKPAPTVIEAGDVKVMGPGVTESVFQGTERQADSAVLTAQQAARDERLAMGEPNPPPDLHATARRMAPEAFERYEALQERQAEFRRAIAEAEEAGQPAPAIKEHLRAVDAELATLAPEVSAAYRRAADAVGGETAAHPNAVVRSFTTAKGSTYDVHGDGSTTRNKSFHPEHGAKDQGPQPRSEATFYVPMEDAIKLGEFQAEGQGRRAIAKLSDGRWGLKYLEGKDSGKFERRTVVSPQTEPAAGLVPVEIWKGGERVHFGNEITEVREPNVTRVTIPESTGSVLGTPIEAQRNFITQDVEKKLIAAGRPAEEAKAAAQLIAARYETRAGRFGGKIGNAQELYLREAPEIVGPGGKVVKTEPPERPREDLARLINSGAAPEEIAAHPVVREANEYNNSRPPTTALPGYGTPAFKANREFNVPGKTVKGYDQAIDHLAETARGYSKDGPVKRDREATLVWGPPAAGKSFFSERIAKAKKAAIVDPDDAKKIIPQFENGRATSAVHEESSELSAQVLRKLVENGDNLVLPRVGQDLAKAREYVTALQEQGYHVSVVNMTVEPAEAYRRMMRRFLKTGRVIGSDYFSAVGAKPRENYYTLKKEGVFDEGVDINANGPPGTQHALDNPDSPFAEVLGLRRDHVGQGVEGAAKPTEASPAPQAQDQTVAAEPVRAAYEAVEKIDTLTPAQQKRALPKYDRAKDGDLPSPGPDKPVGVFMFDPAALNVDAKRFQFKSGGDDYGVTGALRTVEKWDPAKAQAIIAWEQNDGQIFVADGHQRAGLARRLTEQGKAKDIELPGLLYREVDGISAEDVRAIAAVTNIANGSGSALDGAKVLRARPDLMDGSLPLTAGKGQQAAALARLGDEPFRMVVNDVVPEHFGAIVGELIPTDHARQTAAMKALARFEPKNAEEAAVLTQRVAAAELAKREEGAQTSMFGDLETPESTAGEEMRIVGRAIKELKKDKALFARVLANAERIEQTGSTIARETAKTVATDADVFAKTLATDAYAAGPIRNELIAAAKELKDGKSSIGDASTRILAALRRQVEENGADRVGNRGQPVREFAQAKDLPTFTTNRTVKDDGRVTPLSRKQATDWLKEQGAVERQASVTKDVTLPSGDILPNRTLNGTVYDLPDGRTVEIRFESGSNNPASPQSDRTSIVETRPEFRHAAFEPGAEGKPQQLIPGVEPVSTRERIQRLANEPLRGGAKPMDEGLFGERRQGELFQTARGKIRLAEGRKPIITLMKDANPSTFIHETGHQWLEELQRDAFHPSAPDVVKNDAQTVREWLGVKDPDEIKTRHHEKFARGFEQYVREGVAPSPQLAGVFARFKDWLVSIYQSLKGLGAPINEEIRGVFDRMIAMEPQRTVIAPEKPTGPTIHDIHEADAQHTPVHEAEPAADRIAAETTRFENELSPEVKRELETKVAEIQPKPEAGAEPAGETGGGAAEGADLGGGGGEPGAQPGGGARGAQPGAIEPGRGEPAGEGAGGKPDRAAERDHPLAPGPADLLGPRESPLTDKAGNIRIENLTTREDVAQSIREAAERGQDFVGDRRGVVTDGQVMELADALGMDFNALMKRKVGDAFNAEQVVAARKLLVQSATDLSALMKKAFNGTDDDVLAYAMGRDRHQMIQAQVAGITAEAGRALRAFRDISMGAEAKAADQIAREATGKTLFQLRQEAALGATLETPQAISKFMQDAQKRSFGHMVLEYWINGLLSGPATHTTNIMGNLILTLQHTGPETAMAALIGQVRKATGREGEVVRIGEVGARLKAIAGALPSALKGAGESFRSGTSMLLPGETAKPLPFETGRMNDLAARPVLDEAATYSSVMAETFGAVQGLRDGIMAAGALLKAGGETGAPLVGTRYSLAGAIPDITVRGVNVLPVGTAARLPGRFLAAADAFFRAVNYSMEKNARAYRLASEEGHTGTAFDARVADVRQNPPESMMQNIVEETSRLTLMDRGGKFLAALSHLSNVEIGGFPALKFVSPFVHVAGNILKQTVVERTPFGLLSGELRADLMGKNGNVAQDMAQARMLLGTGLSVTMGLLAAEGLASGSGPTDRNEAAMWRLAGNQPHSIRIGDTWYSTQKLGPMGLLLGIAADMYDVSKSANEGEMAEAASHLIHAFSQNVIDQSVMKGPSDLLQAINDSDRYGSQYVRNFMSSFVPYSVGMSQVARAQDPYTRQARTVVDAIRAKVPGHLDSWFDNEMFPKRNIWGAPMLATQTVGGSGVTGIQMREVSTDPVNIELFRLGISPAPVQRKIRNVDLTDKQFDEFAAIAGTMTKSRLDTIVNSPDWRTFPDYMKIQVVNAQLKAGREAARGLMMMKYPTIPVDAVKARRDKLLNED